ncbi:hypothetical protein Acr_14g0004820 [Actinidia rufa]|uniref:Reverse transcriptase domain-containing protein n=1 Tax=Actinidia rufa TaxID=165716 RepID=A0A7J0FR30_9ERIC|nr:hypothetical protein Acr_14g0004820 [Actinidia rufa]
MPYGKALKNAYAEDSQEREFTLKQQVTYLWKEDDKIIGEHIQTFKGLCDSLATIGKPVPDKEKSQTPKDQNRDYSPSPTLSTQLRRPLPPRERRMTPAERDLYREEKCQYCGMMGHIAKIFWWVPKRPTQQDDIPQALAALTLVDNTIAETEWTSDTGASNYMTAKQGALHMTINPVFHTRSKHIELDHHFVRERVALGLLITQHISTSNQVADLFIKPMSKATLNSFLPKHCLHSWHNLREGIGTTQQHGKLVVICGTQRSDKAEHNCWTDKVENSHKSCYTNGEKLKDKGDSMATISTRNVQAITILRSGKAIDKTILPIDPKGRGEASKVVEGTVGEDSETGEKKESEVVPREEENKNEKGNDERKEKTGSVPKSEEVLREEREIFAHAPFPYRLAKPKNNLSSEIYETFKQVKINLPLLEAVKQVPSHDKFLKDLCTVKRRLNVRENAFLAKDVHSVVQVKTPPKYKDSGCPTVTCVIADHMIEGCLLDLGSSVNLLPYSVYEKLGLGELKSTRITLQLADRSIKAPRGIVEAVLVKVDKFYYPANFVVLDTQPVVDPHAQNHIPIILGRLFLATCDAIIQMRGGLLKLSFENMAVELNMFNAGKQLGDLEDIWEVNFIEYIVQEHFERQYVEDPLGKMLMFGEGIDCLKVEKVGNFVSEDNDLEVGHSPIYTALAPLFALIAFILRKGLSRCAKCNGIMYQIADSKWMSPTQVVPKKFGVTVVKNVNNELIPTRIQIGWRMCVDYRRLNAVTTKDHFSLPFLDQVLERVAGRAYYCFLDGYSGYNQLEIAMNDQDKTIFTCPFGLYNAPATFQRCMISIFSDMVEQIWEVFMDDFSVYGDSYDQCFENLGSVLRRCKESNLVLNWEKCYFMVIQAIVLGHIISRKGIEVDPTKVELIQKLPAPQNVRDVRSSLGHADHFSRLPFERPAEDDPPICETFLDEQLMSCNAVN